MAVNYQVKEPQKKFLFDIQPHHVEGAVQNDPTQCVIAQAILDKDRYDHKILEVIVRKSITILVYRGGKRERYMTPPELARGLKEYDNTGEWNLPAGRYCLNPVPPYWRLAAEREKARKRFQNGYQRKKGNPPKKRRKYHIGGRDIVLKEIRDAGE